MPKGELNFKDEILHGEPHPSKSYSIIGFELKKLGFNFEKGKFLTMMECEVNIAGNKARGRGFNDKFKFENMDRVNLIRGGVFMEDIKNELEVINREVLESKKILENLSNEIRAVSDIVEPALLKQIKDIREHRMSLISELKNCLNMLQDVRKFFLDSDYKIEMERLERFIGVCKEIQILKQEGVFDDICNSAIRMAIREEKK